MTNKELNNDAQEQPPRNLNDLLFVKLGLPEIQALRTMRGFVLDEVLAALFRAGILTKEALSRALAEGELAVKETCQRLDAAVSEAADSAEASTQMAEAAAAFTERIRNKFIDEKHPSESE